MTGKRQHWSYSAINQYLRCPLQFYFERVLRLPRKTVSSGLVLGSAVHAALATFHRGLMAAREPDRKEVLKSFLTEWHYRESLEEIQFRAGESESSLAELGMSLIETYLADHVQDTIVSVEQSIKVPMQNSQGIYLEVPLAMIADLVTRNNDGLKIVEFKTAGRSYSTLEVDSSLQATCYANGLWETYAELATIEFAVMVKTKKPKLQRIETRRGHVDFGRLGDVVETIERAIAVDAFFPVETPLNCSGCPFREPCLEWRPGAGNVSENCSQSREAESC